MKLSGLHLLLTYQCNFECAHCFVWGSPWQSGTMTLRDIRFYLQQAKEHESIKWIYFEGGEPSLYYVALLKGVQEAHAMGFQVGIVSNAYWATSLEDALENLRPFSGLVSDLSLSSDLYHYNEKISQQVQFATQAARQLDIPLGVISVAQPEEINAAKVVGQLPEDESGVMYRGRAAQKLAERAGLYPWEEFTHCPFEDLQDPDRVHLDPLGNLHICQGITIGNLFQTPLTVICASYNPEFHPIINPILKGGPAELVRNYDIPHGEKYADACHLCYESRCQIRQRFPEILTPDQMYGEFE